AFRDGGGARHADAQDVEHGRRLLQRHLLMDHHLFDEAQALAAVFLRPRQTDEARIEEGLLPFAEELIGFGSRNLGQAEFLPVVGDICGQPATDALAQRFLVGRQCEIHNPSWRMNGQRALTERWFILGMRPRRSQGIYSPIVLSVSLQRLQNRVLALARFGALPGGGVTRMCWSPPHEEARAWLLSELKVAGLNTWVDAAGNVFGALGADGLTPGAPVVLTGSHIDTVPEGGILDGALGVLAGLECLHVIRESGTPTARPLAVAAWSDEEGRYGSLFGSRAFCGRLDAAAIPTTAAVDGDRLVDAMRRAGFDAQRAPEAAAPRGSVAAYVELHIEQGPRLEEAGIPIGVVEAIVGVRRARVVFHGQADHAGTT